MIGLTFIKIGEFDRSDGSDLFAQTISNVDFRTVKKIIIVERLENFDDVKNVFSNFDIDDDTSDI